jgi:hypothetical protein
VNEWRAQNAKPSTPRGQRTFTIMDNGPKLRSIEEKVTSDASNPSDVPGENVVQSAESRPKSTSIGAIIEGRGSDATNQSNSQVAEHCDDGERPHSDLAQDPKALTVSPNHASTNFGAPGSTSQLPSTRILVSIETERSDHSDVSSSQVLQNASDIAADTQEGGGNLGTTVMRTTTLISDG